MRYRTPTIPTTLTNAKGERRLTSADLRRINACPGGITHAAELAGGDSVMISEAWAERMGANKQKAYDLAFYARTAGLRLLPEFMRSIHTRVTQNELAKHYHLPWERRVELRDRIELRTWAALYVEAGKP